MYRSNMLIILIFTSFLGACVSGSPPSAESLKAMSVVTMGNPVPEGQEYVLYIPKGEPIPLEFTMTGYLLDAPVRQEFSTRIQRDLYLYKYWLSYDKQTWLPYNKVLGAKISAGMDGKKGTIHVELTDVNKKSYPD